jgi:hypothetical protein
MDPTDPNWYFNPANPISPLNPTQQDFLNSPSSGGPMPSWLACVLMAILATVILGMGILMWKNR